jgi:hypothetical protein
MTTPWRVFTLLAAGLSTGAAWGAEVIPPATIMLRNHTIKDANGRVASELRNIRMTFLRREKVGEFQFVYAIEWDISNVTHNVMKSGINGPDSRLYLTLRGKGGGEKWISIMLPGRSDCGVHHVKTERGFPVVFVDMGSRISLSDNGVVGPQAVC